MTENNKSSRLPPKVVLRRETRKMLRKHSKLPLICLSGLLADGVIVGGGILAFSHDNSSGQHSALVGGYSSAPKPRISLSSSLSPSPSPSTRTRTNSEGEQSQSSSSASSTQLRSSEATEASSYAPPSSYVATSPTDNESYATSVASSIASFNASLASEASSLASSYASAGYSVAIIHQ